MSRRFFQLTGPGTRVFAGISLRSEVLTLGLTTQALGSQSFRTGESSILPGGPTTVWVAAWMSTGPGRIPGPTL